MQNFQQPWASVDAARVLLSSDMPHGRIPPEISEKTVKNRSPYNGICKRQSSAEDARCGLGGSSNLVGAISNRSGALNIGNLKNLKIQNAAPLILGI